MSQHGQTEPLEAPQHRAGAEPLAAPDPPEQDLDDGDQTARGSLAVAASPMSPAIRRFVSDQVDRLEPFEFVTVGASTSMIELVEIGRSDGGDYEVRVPPRPFDAPLELPIRTKLFESGFRSADPSNPLVPWVAAAEDGQHAIETALATLHDVFTVDVTERLDLVHGSHRAEHEAMLQLASLRHDVELVLGDMLGRVPEQDVDRDYVYPMDHIHVVVAPRVIPGAIALVRVFAITNVGVAVTPELGLFLARLNFGLMFGRFALDAEHRAIWFDETLLGDDVTDRQLRFTIDMVARTAAEWTDRLRHMFGGRAPHDVEQTERDRTTKPGTAGYL